MSSHLGLKCEVAPPSQNWQSALVHDHYRCLPAVQMRAAAHLELWGVQRANAVITVSRGLQSWLDEACQVPAAVLYDKAPAFFSPVSAKVVRTTSTIPDA
jgi:hypothetical protein